MLLGFCGSLLGELDDDDVGALLPVALRVGDSFTHLRQDALLDAQHELVARQIGELGETFARDGQVVGLLMSEPKAVHEHLGDVLRGTIYKEFELLFVEIGVRLGRLSALVRAQLKYADEGDVTQPTHMLLS